MNWSTIKTAVKTWVRTATGLSAEHVFWQQQDRPRPSGPYIVMDVTALRRVGQSWVDVVDNTLTVADTVESVDATANTLTLTAHGLLTGDGPVQLETTDTLPDGLEEETDYWIIKVDADTIKLAASFPDAMNAVPVPVDLLDVGVGTHSIENTAETLRVGQEIIHRVRGPRVVRVTMQCYLGEGPGLSSYLAVDYLERVIAATKLPTVRAALVTGGVGIGPVGEVFGLDGFLGESTFEPRATVDIHLHTTSEVTENTTFIDYVEVEEVDEDGVHVDSTYVPEDPT